MIRKKYINIESPTKLEVNHNINVIINLRSRKEYREITIYSIQPICRYLITMGVKLFAFRLHMFYGGVGKNFPIFHFACGVLFALPICGG